VLILWNSNSDKVILKKLGITEFPILNLKCYDKYFNKQFVIQLEKLENKQLLFEVDVRIYDKRGRLLNLEETHGLICSKQHKVTHAHDPRKDVINFWITFVYFLNYFVLQLI